MAMETVYPTSPENSLATSTDVRKGLVELLIHF